MPQPRGIVLHDVLRAFGLRVRSVGTPLSGDSSPFTLLNSNWSSFDLPTDHVNVLVTRGDSPECIVLAEASAFDAITIAGENASGTWVSVVDLPDWQESAVEAGASVTFVECDGPGGVPGFTVVESWSDAQLGVLALATVAVARCLRWELSSVTTTLQGEHRLFPSRSPWRAERWHSVLRGRDTSPIFPTPENPLYWVQPNDNWENIAAKLLGTSGRSAEIAELNGGLGVPVVPGTTIIVPADGVVVPQRILSEAPSPNGEAQETSVSAISMPMVSPGEQGSHVRLLRVLLDGIGYPSGSLSALYDDRLDAAIQQFRGDHSLHRTNQFDADCWVALFGVDSLPVIGKKSSERIVRLMKALLVLAGENPGPVTGTVDSQITDAVTSYQSKHDIPSTGKTDAITWRLLLGLL